MTPATRAWLEGLRESVAGAAPAAPDDPAARSAEAVILSAHLATWLDATPALLECRREFARASGGAADPEAGVVITTSPVGLAVAGDVLGRDEPLARSLRALVVCTTERDYRAWCMLHPDPAHRHHLNHWSWIKTRLPPQRRAAFARHRLGAGACHWLHRTGTAGAGTADGRAAHLWAFDGRHATLVQPFVVERLAPPPGD